MSASFCTSCQMDEDASTLKSCSGCSTVRYCSKECQSEHWKIHKLMCRQLKPDEVWGIKLLCKRELAALPPSPEPDIARRIKHILLKKNHAVFTKGDLCPATQAYGFPLLIFSDGVHLGRQGKGSENQPAVYLRIEPEDGFAPPNWQMLDPDDCIVVRRDCKPLTREAMEACYAFHAMLMSDVYGYPEEHGWPPGKEHITRAAFPLFYRKYYRDQHELGRKQFKPVYRPL
ncbi:ectomycorrhiza-upregulated zf-MYND domain-containing protein [Mycena metata]|uniref:Ectomycorrhiza-upregulated zf-MYND domain-containing protein n=1 Tax=Mycena metata TaxID=1033252 RepID=A0AAD7NJ70_9AGAR|nr:ectomycorrhiza-upregulated zf-MYND domain-containing protein [Mycena metata]